MYNSRTAESEAGKTCTTSDPYCHFTNSIEPFQTNQPITPQRVIAPHNLPCCPRENSHITKATDKIAGIAVSAKRGSAGVNAPYRSLMVIQSRNVPVSHPINANIRSNQGRIIKMPAMRPNRSTIKNSARVFNACEMTLSKLEIII